MSKKNSSEVPDQPKKDKGLVALKDWRITQNEVDIVIKKDDDLSTIPKIYLENLKTEGVIS